MLLLLLKLSLIRKYTNKNKKNLKKSIGEKANRDPCIENTQEDSRT